MSRKHVAKPVGRPNTRLSRGKIVVGKRPRKPKPPVVSLKRRGELSVRVNKYTEAMARELLK